MSGIVCPYCRAPIDDSPEDVRTCAGCETPHHADCYEENGGCTVFGCRCAPADEPTVVVSGDDLSAAAAPAPSAPPPLRSAVPPPPPPPGVVLPPPPLAQEWAPAVTVLPESAQKSTTTYTLLGVFLGALGVHNFYAGYADKAIAQLCITLLTLGYGSPFSWIWAIVEVCTVRQDSRGVSFKS